jgi:hypothetical protein
MGFQLDDGKPERGDGYTTLWLHWISLICILYNG